MNKITFLHDIDISDEYIRRYNLESLMKAVNVNYIYFKEAAVIKSDPLHSQIITKKICARNFIGTAKNIECLVLTASDTFLLFAFLTIFQLFGGRTIKIYWGYFPTSHDNSSRLKKIIDLKSYTRYINKIVFFIFSKLFLKKIDFGLYAGDVAKLKAQFASHHVYPIQHWDARDIGENTSESLSSSKNILFLDENLPYHIDYNLLGWPYIEANTYFQSVNSFLRELSFASGCKVMIAAHPKADLEVLKYKYDFEVLQDQTKKMINEASLVVTHVSTSVGMAAMLGKVIIVYCDPRQYVLYKNNRYPWIEALAHELDTEVTFDSMNVYTSSIEGAKRYVEKYIGYSKNDLSAVLIGLMNA